MNGDYSRTRWGDEDCETVLLARLSGYVWGYLSGGEYYMATDRYEIPSGAPFTSLDSEWLRHCVG